MSLMEAAVSCSRVPTMSQAPLLTLAAVAAYLAVPVEGVKRLALDGELRVLRIGSDRRVRPEDLQAFLRAAEE